MSATMPGELPVLDAIDTGDAPPRVSVTLDFQQRERSRLRVTLDDGAEAAIRLPRGTVLRGGDRLRAADGWIVEVRAAAEKVSEVRTDSPIELARAAYHLGNRHVAVQVGDGWLRYRHDHVLDEMMSRLGLRTVCTDAPFEPESGAYSGHGHHHGHGHGHDHAHE